MVEGKLAEGVCQVVLEKAYDVDKRWTSFSVVLPAKGHYVIPELRKQYASLLASTQYISTFTCHHKSYIGD